MTTPFLTRRAVIGGLALLPLAGTGALAQPAAPSGGHGVAEYVGRFDLYREEASRSADYLPELEAAALDATNAYRAEQGLPLLDRDGQLAWIGRFFGNSLGRQGRMEHVDEEGRSPGDRIALLHRQQIGPGGENLFGSNIFRRSDPVAAAELAVDGLMDSPGHRENILNRDWTHAGMGAVVTRDERNGRDAFILVQMFARREDFLAEPAPLRIAAGARLPSAFAALATGRPDRMGLFPAGTKPVMEGFAPLGSGRAPERPSTYQCWYAVPEGQEGRTTRFGLHPGPMVTVAA